MVNDWYAEVEKLENARLKARVARLEEAINKSMSSQVNYFESRAILQTALKENNHEN